MKLKHGLNRTNGVLHAFICRFERQSNTEIRSSHGKRQHAFVFRVSPPVKRYLDHWKGVFGYNRVEYVPLTLYFYFSSFLIRTLATRRDGSGRVIMPTSKSVTRNFSTATSAARECQGCRFLSRRRGGVSSSGGSSWRGKAAGSGRSRCLFLTVLRFCLYLIFHLTTDATARACVGETPSLKT